VEDWAAAVKLLARTRGGKSDINELRKDVETKRQAMDFYNRYSIAVRGASAAVYGILNEADIVKEFGIFLGITMPPPLTYQDRATDHMRPLERFGDSSPHTQWMSSFC
jgi:hypothetical protein